MRQVAAMANPSHLRLVPFNPSDYSLGEVLVRESQEKITDLKVIGAALSLYFQWPEESRALMIVGSRESFDIFIEYDREERVPSEFKILFRRPEDLNEAQVTGEVLIRFETFRQCFEFTIDEVAVNADAVADPSWHIIVAPPTELLVYKHRRLPRVSLSESDRELIGPVEVQYAADGKSTPVKLIEMGMKSVRVMGVDFHVGEPVRIKLRGQTLPVKVLRQDMDYVIFEFKVNSAGQVGQIFDIYRLVAFPHLRPRHDYTNQQMAQLYSDTNYLGKFTTDEAYGERVHALAEVWDEVSKAQHSLSADYVTIAEDGSLAGASSCSLAFHYEGRDLWIFHQLCAKTSPNLLAQSGELYTWRAEYLAGRTEDLGAGVWFDSKSRWLERIYVKFAFHKGNNVRLIPVSIFRRVASRGEPVEGVEVNTIQIGKYVRAMVDSREAFGAVNPGFLNAANILDAIVCLKDCEAGTINDFVTSLCEKIGQDQRLFELTIPIERSEQFTQLPNDQKLTDCDRLCLFHKSSLVDFISSVQHSVAVTKRKKTAGYGSEAS